MNYVNAHVLILTGRGATRGYQSGCALVSAYLGKVHHSHIWLS